MSGGKELFGVSPCLVRLKYCITFLTDSRKLALVKRFLPNADKFLGYLRDILGFDHNLIFMDEVKDVCNGFEMGLSWVDCLLEIFFCDRSEMLPYVARRYYIVFWTVK